jgi:hypothetical protein
MNMISPDNLWSLSPSNSADGFMPHVSSGEWDDCYDVGVGNTLAGEGTVLGAVENSPNGVVALKTKVATPADNDEGYRHRTAKSYLFGSEPIFFESRIKPSAVVTDAVVTGFASVLTDLIADAGAALIADFSGALWFLPKNGTGWSLVTSIGTTQVVTANVVPATRNAWVRLGIRYEPGVKGKAKVIGYANGKEVVIHELDNASAAAMHRVDAGIKVGAAAQGTVLIDYVKTDKTR